MIYSPFQEIQYQNKTVSCCDYFTSALDSNPNEKNWGFIKNKEVDLHPALHIGMYVYPLTFTIFIKSIKAWSFTTNKQLSILIN